MAPKIEWNPTPATDMERDLFKDFIALVGRIRGAKMLQAVGVTRFSDIETGELRAMFLMALALELIVRQAFPPMTGDDVDDVLGMIKEERENHGR